MASWLYIFLFPGTNGRLDPASAVHVLRDFGLVFDESARTAIEIDGLGHLEYGEETLLGQPALCGLKQRLSDDGQLMIVCRNSELLCSCCFATRYSNPYVMLGWPKRLFLGLSQSRQEAYWKMFRQFAKLCRAAYVVIVSDPPDFFEDRFMEIDGRRYLEIKMPCGKEYHIHSIWTNAELCGKIPEGVDESSRRVLPDGFVQYFVASTPPRPAT